jgi:hypothetical protein
VFSGLRLPKPCSRRGFVFFRTARRTQAGLCVLPLFADSRQAQNAGGLGKTRQLSVLYRGSPTSLPERNRLPRCDRLSRSPRAADTMKLVKRQNCAKRAVLKTRSLKFVAPRATAKSIPQKPAPRPRRPAAPRFRRDVGRLLCFRDRCEPLRQRDQLGRRLVGCRPGRRQMSTL